MKRKSRPISGLMDATLLFSNRPPRKPGQAPENLPRDAHFLPDLDHQLCQLELSAGFGGELKVRCDLIEPGSDAPAVFFG